MLTSSILTPLPVAIPLVGAALLAALRKWLSRCIADALGVIFAATTLCVCIALLLASLHNGSVYWFGNWFPRGSIIPGIGFLVEPVAASIASLAAWLVLLALIFSWGTVDDGGHHLQPLMLIFLAAMCGFAFTVDLFNLFVFFELMSTAAFALCGLKTAEPAPLQGAFNFAVTNTVAAFMVLTGIALLYAITGALNMAQIGLLLQQRHDPLVLLAFSLLVCGFLIKAAIVPFHLWLPDAHAVAPTPVCVLFSGLMVELGLYAIVRIRTLVFGQTFLTHEFGFRHLLIFFGVVTIILGGLMCYSEHHLKRMLAFSTISHAGIMLVAIAIGTPVALASWLMYLIAHALIKGSLFFSSGIILHRLRFIGERELFGKGRQLRWTAILWFLGAIGLASAPPFGTLIAEAGIDHAAKLCGLDYLSLCCLIGGVLTSAAVLRVGMHTFLGWGTAPITDEAAEVGELPEDTSQNDGVLPSHFLPALLCIGLAIGLTFSTRYTEVLRNAMRSFTDQRATLHLIYTGQGTLMQAPAWNHAISETALRGTLALFGALLLACTSVFRNNLRRQLRFGPILESGIPALRAMQSGHPGDYVFWLTIGTVIFTSISIFCLRI